MMDATAWNEQDHGLHHSADDDIRQFLDMNSMSGFPDGLQFDFGFQPQNGAASHLLQRETLDTPMSGTDATVIMATTMHDQLPALTSAPLHTAIPSSMLPSQPAPGDAICEIDAQIQFLQAQKIQQQQRQLEQQQQQHEQQRRQLEQQQAAFFAQQQSRIVPATPQSLEMRAGDGPYTFQPDHTPQHHADIYEHFHMKEQIDMSFTPLVSPAVTPLESQFPIDQAFAVPSAYFSPLTSPALHAQSDPMTMLDRTTMATSTSSPEDMDLEAVPPPQSQAQPQSVVDLTKKLRKGSASKSRGKASVGKSPITKPQRKKTGSTPLMNAQALSDLAETVEQQPRPAKASRLQEPSSNASNSSAAGITDSENSSVSPETLSEMPPPPLPLSRSAKPSPAIQPQNMATPTMGPHLGARTGKHSPATPASLMKLPSPSNANRPDAIAESDAVAAENIENFELPESVNSSTFRKPALTPLLTHSPSLRSPALESTATRSSAFQPLPSPVFAKAGKAASVSGSPQIVANSSATNTPNLRKTPQLAPRMSKKRASISSSHVSPALRPRISPNIKPLLPGGVTAEDTASRLLASKSNYQNILEGNLVPGVSYPSELSTNLTSKRTSHKIAEQGRRNRINSALQEIATLLPGGALLDGKDSEAESSDRKDSKNGGTPNSKASTVEMAIEYIKQLRQEVAEANKRAEEAEKKLQDREGVSAS